jgi:hypothetical protein
LRYNAVGESLGGRFGGLGSLGARLNALAKGDGFGRGRGGVAGGGGFGGERDEFGFGTGLSLGHWTEEGVLGLGHRSRVEGGKL